MEALINEATCLVVGYLTRKRSTVGGFNGIDWSRAPEHPLFRSQLPSKLQMGKPDAWLHLV